MSTQNFSDYLKRQVLLEKKAYVLRQTLSEEEIGDAVHFLIKESEVINEGLFSAVGSLIGGGLNKVKQFLSGRAVSYLGIPKRNPLYGPLTNFISSMPSRDILALYRGDPEKREKLVDILTDETVNILKRDMDKILGVDTRGSLGGPIASSMTDVVKSPAFKQSVKASFDRAFNRFINSDVGNIEAIRQVVSALGPEVSSLSGEVESLKSRIRQMSDATTGTETDGQDGEDQEDQGEGEQGQGQGEGGQDQGEGGQDQGQGGQGGQDQGEGGESQGGESQGGESQGGESQGGEGQQESNPEEDIPRPPRTPEEYSSYLRIIKEAMERNDFLTALRYTLSLVSEAKDSELPFIYMAISDLYRKLGYQQKADEYAEMAEALRPKAGSIQLEQRIEDAAEFVDDERYEQAVRLLQPVASATDSENLHHTLYKLANAANLQDVTTAHAIRYMVIKYLDIQSEKDEEKTLEEFLSLVKDFIKDNGKYKKVTKTQLIPDKIKEAAEDEEFRNDFRDSDDRGKLDLLIKRGLLSQSAIRKLEKNIPKPQTNNDDGVDTDDEGGTGTQEVGEPPETPDGEEQPDLPLGDQADDSNEEEDDEDKDDKDKLDQLSLFEESVVISDEILNRILEL